MANSVDLLIVKILKPPIVLLLAGNHLKCLMQESNTISGDISANKTGSAAGLKLRVWPGNFEVWSAAREWSFRLFRSAIFKRLFRGI